VSEWLLVGLSRPECVETLRENISRQEHKTRVCIVENGAGEGLCEKAGLSPDLLLKGPTHPAGARNVGLQAIRDRDGYFVIMDEDDYYGPLYVSEHMSLRKEGRLVGKRVHWVHHEGEGLCLYAPGRANRKSSWLRGGTIGGHSRETEDFPHIDLAEDTELCQNFLRKGGEVWNSSVSHCAYVRRKDIYSHAYCVFRDMFDIENGPIVSRVGGNSWDEVNKGRISGQAP